MAVNRVSPFANSAGVPAAGAADTDGVDDGAGAGAAGGDDVLDAEPDELYDGSFWHPTIAKTATDMITITPHLVLILILSLTP